MDEREWLTERFEEHRRHLTAVAYRMLGSVTEAEDALQEAWLRIPDPYIVPTLVNGTAGAVIAPNRQPFAVMGFTISSGRITAIDVLVDPERLNQLDLTIP